MAECFFGSTICIVFVFIPTVQGAFWVLSALLVQLYLLMYIMLFAAVYRLRQTQPDRHRPWQIPGGKAGLTAACGLGLVFSAAAFLVGFFPPSSLQVSELNYLAVLGTGLALSVGTPIALILLRRRRQTNESHPAKLS